MGSAIAETGRVPPSSPLLVQAEASSLTVASVLRLHCCLVSSCQYKQQKDYVCECVSVCVKDVSPMRYDCDRMGESALPSHAHTMEPNQGPQRPIICVLPQATQSSKAMRITLELENMEPAQPSVVGWPTTVLASFLPPPTKPPAKTWRTVHRYMLPGWALAATAIGIGRVHFLKLERSQHNPWRHVGHCHPFCGRIKGCQPITAVWRA